MSVYVPVPDCFCYYGPVMCLKVCYCNSPALLFLLRIVLAILDLFCFHMNFRIAFLIIISETNEVGI